ncbi:unnamed protein product [Closterium sp. Naga37s-1]|nr:unnamed protein product [Closterium sp. Naga37s-1]
MPDPPCALLLLHVLFCPSMCSSAPPCALLLLHVLFCSSMCSSAPPCALLLLHVLFCSSMCSSAPPCALLLLHVLFDRVGNLTHQLKSAGFELPSWVVILYETKGKAKEDKGKATAAAMEAISGGFGPSGKRKISDYFGGDAAVAKAKADESLCLFFAGLRIPEHHADHPLFRNMLRAAAEAGPGYVPPESIDCGKDQKTGTYIADMLRPIVEEVGPQNVVALCTDGGSNYRSACRKLGVEFPHIELTPCATHVIDLLLEDVGKMDWAKKLVDRGNGMINFLRKHHWTRAMLRDPTLPGDKVLQALRPAGTRFGTQYIAMSRLCELEQKLIVLVTGDLWKGWAVGDREEGAEKFAKEVIDPAWWKSAAFFVKLLQRPYEVMRMTDSTRPEMMGRMYDLMLQLTEDMEKVLDADEQQLSRAEKMRISRILKDRWDNSLACAMHVAGRILNPLNQDEEIFGIDVECTKVFKEFIARAQDFYKKYPAMSGVVGREVDLEAAVTAYLESRGSCGMPKAMEAREKVKQGKQTMEQWWMWHCTEWPELARLARRVLSQPVSAASCERNWSMWDLVHTARRNKLGSVKCRDLVYVAHNWNVVHNFHKGPQVGVVKGNIPEAPILEGYVVEEEEEEEEEADEADPKVLEDEYKEYQKKP